MYKPSIYFFCPAYNEEANLEQFVRHTVSVLGELTDDYLFTVVDDGSTDWTGKIADQLAKEFKRVRVIHHEANMGYAKALTTGFTAPERERYDLIGYADSDGQIETAETRRFVSALRDSDVAMGCRSKRADNFFRRIQSWVYNKLNRMLFGLNFQDVNCPLKIFRREVLQHIEIEDTSFFIDSEIIVKARLAGYVIEEIEVEHSPRASGSASGQRPRLVLATVWGMAKFLFRYVTGRLKYTKK